MKPFILSRAERTNRQSRRRRRRRLRVRVPNPRGGQTNIPRKYREVMFLSLSVFSITIFRLEYRSRDSAPSLLSRPSGTV